MEPIPRGRGAVLEPILGYARKGVWTIVDQALFAGSNFVLNILLIHAVSDESYGAYAVAFAIFLFFSMIHTGLFTEPMLVFGAGRFKGRFHHYFSLLRRGHVWFGIAALVLLAAIAFVARIFGKAELSDALYAAAVAQPFILFLWLARRACYVHLKPKWSAIGGLVYAVVLLGGVFLLSRLAVLTVPMMFGLMGIASLIGGVWILVWIRRVLPKDNEELLASDVVLEHRKYGGWAVATGVLAWLPSNIPFLVLEFAHGPASPGVLKAMLNFIMPAAHAYAALSILLVPIFVRAREQGRFRSIVFSTAALLVLANVSYWVLLGVFGSSLINFLYSGNYIEYASLLWLAGLYPIVSGVAVVIRTALRSMERPNFVFWSSVGSSICALTLTVFLIFQFGVRGAIIGISLNMLVELGVMAVYFQSTRALPDLAAQQQTTPGH